MNINQEYSSVITRLAQATEFGKIEWKKQNPTTIFYEMSTISGDTALISIQKVKRAAVDQYIFTVRNLSKKDSIVTIDTINDEYILPLIANLYEISNYSIEKKSLDFLNDILNSI